MNPITWRKDGTLISMGNSAYINIIETKKSSLLSLSGLKLSDSGNYSCQSQTENGTLSKWIFLKVRSKTDTSRKEGSRVVADEPNSHCASLNCASNESCIWDRTNHRFRCVSTNPDPTRKVSFRRQRPIPPDVDLHDFNGPPHFDSVHLAGHGETREDSFFASIPPQAVDYDKTTPLPHECAESPEGCNTPSLFDLGLDGRIKEPAAVTGGPFALIGIGTMCALFLVIVLVSAFVIRRKIVRQQREFSYNQRNRARGRPFITTNRTNMTVDCVRSQRRHQGSTSGPLEISKPLRSAERMHSPTPRISRSINEVRSTISPLELKTLTVNANTLADVPQLPTRSTTECSLVNTQGYLQGNEIRTFDKQEVVYLENYLDVGNLLLIQPTSQLMDSQWMLDSDNEIVHYPAFSGSAVSRAT
ncbi:hypothetical protein SprV_0802548700 [Sparganum proliferum]